MSRPPPAAPAPVTTLDERVRREQLTMAERLMPLGLAFVLAVMLVNAWVAWREETRSFLSSGLVVGLLMAAFVVVRARQFHASDKGSTSIARRLRERMMFAGTGSLIVGVCLAFMFVHASDGDRGIIMASAAGLISAVVCFSPVTWIAMSYLTPLTLICFATLLSTGRTNYMVVAVLLTLYALFLTFLVRSLAGLIRNRVASEVGLERERALTAQLLQDFERNADDWLWEIDDAHCISHASSRLASVLGLSNDALHGANMMDRMNALTEPQSIGILRQMQRRITRHEAFRDCEIALSIGGETRWWRLGGKPIFDADGVYRGYRGVGSDVSLKKAAEDRVSFLAMHDSLTHLPNRTFFNRALADAVAGLDEKRPFAVMCLDLDDFKNINDCFGHAMGDALLKQVAARMRSVLGPDDQLVRMAGDEFCILFTGDNAADRDALRRVGQGIVAAIAEPFPLEGIAASIGVSIGVALAPADGLDETVRRADLALYQSKRQGKNTLNFYDPTMDEQVLQRRALTQDLKQALAKEQFLLNFQPLVNAATGTIQGFEALVRWRHPEHGMISPAEFIPLAEETGIINTLGEWVLNEACRHAVTWPGHLKLAVNVSPIQFHYSDLPGIVAEALKASGLAPERLELELTETAFLEATSNTHLVFEKLHALGVKLALDDFGTGFSSLSYLRSIPFDKVKIDRSFVQGLPRDERDLSIVRAVIDIATSMGMSITAEGVETDEQSRCLLAQGCHQLQGFLFSKPVPGDQALALLKAADEARARA